MAQNTHPELLKLNKSSKYKRYDYERFSHSIPSLVSVGQGSIGKVEVDCRFLFTKSKWGYMGLNSPSASDKHPAGILYLDLVFRQPPDCRLQSATVAVTLGVDEESEQPIPLFPTTMTEHYGPAQLVGSEKSLQSRRMKQFIPHIEVAGYGAGGAGVSNEETRDVTDRWRFSGHLRSADGSLTYNKIEWDLNESFLEERPSHGCIFHTAFAIGHNSKAFQMTVDVKGKLARKKDRLKYAMKNLKFGGNKGETASVKFQWSKGYSSSLWLDRIAQGLPLAMEMENMRSIPVEMPAPQQAVYRPTMESDSLVNPSGHEHHEDVFAPTAHSLNDGRARPVPKLHANPGTSPLALINDMIVAAGLESPALTGIPQQPVTPVLSQASESSSEATLVESSRESESGRGYSPDRREPDRRVRIQPGARRLHTSTSIDKGNEREISKEDQALKTGILLGLLYWLQGLMVWELIAAKLGATAQATQSIPRTVKGNNGREKRLGSRLIESELRDKKPWDEESDEETPVEIPIASSQIKGNQRKEGLEQNWVW